MVCLLPYYYHLTHPPLSIEHRWRECLILLRYNSRTALPRPRYDAAKSYEASRPTEPLRKTSVLQTWHPSRAASLDTPPSKAARRSPAAGLSSIAVERLFGFLQSCGGKAANGGQWTSPLSHVTARSGVSCVSSLSNFAGRKLFISHRLLNRRRNRRRMKHY
jgi:hypothetical protein